MKIRMFGKSGPVEVDENGNQVDKKNRLGSFGPKKIKNLSLQIGISLIIIMVISLIVSQVFFTVNEMESALVVRFGSIQRVIVEDGGDKIATDLKNSGKFAGDVEVVNGKGLMIRIPFVDTVEKYSSQLISYKTLPGEVTALDKKKILLDNNAQWRIVNPALFKITMQSVENGNTRLDDLIFSSIREKIGKINGSRLISDKEFVYEMLSEIRDEVNTQVESYGMEVVDVRIAKTEFPKQNNENIYNRMRTERQKMANKLRAEGEERYKTITADSDKQAAIIKAEAYQEAERIRGEGDAEAIRIYAEAYNKDPEFYNFYKSLEAYKATIGSNTKLIINANSDFAKYLFRYDLAK